MTADRNRAVQTSDIHPSSLNPFGIQRLQIVQCSGERATALLILLHAPLAENQKHRLEDGMVFKNHFYSNFFASQSRKLRPKVRKVLPWVRLSG